VSPRVHAASRVLGLRIALSAPDWLHSQRLGTLTSGPGTDASAAPMAHAGTSHPTPPVGLAPCLDTSLSLLRLLARLPGRRWRNTCLYRSIVTVLCIRSHQGAARLRIGVRASASREEGLGSSTGTPGLLTPSTDPSSAPIEAHAWVESAWIPAEHELPDASPGTTFVSLQAPTRTPS